MFKDLKTHPKYEEHGWEHCSYLGDSQQTEEAGPREEESPTRNGSAFLAYLRTVTSYPLLNSKEEKELAREIQACQEKLLDLFTELPLAFGEIEELRAAIRADKKNAEKRKAHLIEKILAAQSHRWNRKGPKNENLAGSDSSSGGTTPPSL